MPTRSTNLERPAPTHRDGIVFLFTPEHFSRSPELRFALPRIPDGVVRARGNRSAIAHLTIGFKPPAGVIEHHHIDCGFYPGDGLRHSFQTLSY